jgi:hypothetical protein
MYIHKQTCQFLRVKKLCGSGYRIMIKTRIFGPYQKMKTKGFFKNLPIKRIQYQFWGIVCLDHNSVP